MNKCVNIVFILLYSETLFEERNVYVQICKIKNKLCFIYAGLFCSLLNQFFCCNSPACLMKLLIQMSFLFLMNS